MAFDGFSSLAILTDVLPGVVALISFSSRVLTCSSTSQRLVEVFDVFLWRGFKGLGFVEVIKI